MVIVKLFMKKTRVIISFLMFVFIFGFLMVCTVNAVDFPNPKDKYVNDFAGVLGAGQAAEMRDLFLSVEQQTTAEMVFISVNDTGGMDLSSYTFQIANQWKVGKADKNNGLVMVYSLGAGKIFIATGYGIEGILPDSKIGRMLDENYVPLRDNGNVSEGIMQFSRVVAEEMIVNADEIKSGQAGKSSSSGWEGIIGIIIFFLIINFIFKLIARSAAKRKGKSVGGWWPLFIPIGGGSGGGFGGGFGGGGFGGGGFGGGGAGR